MATKSSRGDSESAMQGMRAVRVVRTESSESYILWLEDKRLGQVDFHFGMELVHATLILEMELAPGEQADLIDTLDQDIVSSHLPQFAREDFLVTVYRGSEMESFSDSDLELGEDEESDE